MKIVKKLLVSLVLATGFCLAQADSEQKAIIVQIINNGNCVVKFQGNLLKPGTQKNVLCPVPFISYKENRAAFVFGKPYLPASARRVILADGRIFGVWRSERGFEGAFEQSPDVEHKDAVPKKLLSDNSCKLSRLILAVNAKDVVTLSCQN